MGEVRRAIRERRSVRQFGTEPVERSVVEEILEAGRWAPSGKNTQPWRFVVIQSDGVRAGLAKLAPQAGMIATAPVTIAVLLDRDLGYDDLKDVQGIGAAIQNVLLAAHDLGLGACWMGKTRDPAIEALIGAQGAEELMALIPIGRPSGRPKAPERHDIDRLARFV